MHSVRSEGRFKPYAFCLLPYAQQSHFQSLKGDLSNSFLNKDEDIYLFKFTNKIRKKN